jgi:hypothetical protein
MYTSNFSGWWFGEISALPSMVRGVEMCFLTLPWAVSTQPDLDLNWDKGVHVSWDESGLMVWFQSIQAAVKSKAACFTVSIVVDFFRLSYGLLFPLAIEKCCQPPCPSNPAAYLR